MFFWVLQILFDSVLLFGVLFLFHFSVNQQQQKKEEFDIVKNIQVQEMKENLEKLFIDNETAGEKTVSDDIQRDQQNPKKRLRRLKKSYIFFQSGKNWKVN